MSETGVNHRFPELAFLYEKEMGLSFRAGFKTLAYEKSASLSACRSCLCYRLSVTAQKDTTLLTFLVKVSVGGAERVFL